MIWRKHTSSVSTILHSNYHFRFSSFKTIQWSSTIITDGPWLKCKLKLMNSVSRQHQDRVRNSAMTIFFWQWRRKFSFGYQYCNYKNASWQNFPNSLKGLFTAQKHTTKLNCYIPSEVLSRPPFWLPTLITAFHVTRNESSPLFRRCSKGPMGISFLKDGGDF